MRQRCSALGCSRKKGQTPGVYEHPVVLPAFLLPLQGEGKRWQPDRALVASGSCSGGGKALSSDAEAVQRCHRDADVSPSPGVPVNSLCQLLPSPQSLSLQAQVPGVGASVPTVGGWP